MTESKHSETLASKNKSLNYHDVYTCPVCRHGEISVLTLTESFACNFCRHIFSANLDEQSLILADGTQPLAWRWNGRSWKLAQQKNYELTFVLWLLAVALVVLPTSIVAVSAYIFPAEEGSFGSSLPQVWIGLTFLCHFAFVFWLLAENYQLPFYTYLKVKLRNLRNQQN